MAGHLSPPTNVGETQSGLLEIWVLGSRSSRNWTQNETNETNGTPSGRIIFKYFICQTELNLLISRGYDPLIYRFSFYKKIWE
jgi:hypothetical protein